MIRGRLLPALRVALAVVVGLGLFRVVAHGYAILTLADSLSYARGANLLWHGMSPYAAFQLAGPYSLLEVPNGGGFVYPPTAALLMLPYTWEWFQVLCGTLGLIAFALVAGAIVRREAGGLNRTAALAVAAFVLTMPGTTEVREGTISSMVAALVGLMWLAPRQSAWLAALGAGLKGFPGLGLLWAIRRRAPIWPGLVLATALVLATLPWWGAYVTALFNARASCSAWELPSFACAGMRPMGWAAAACLALSALLVRRDDVAFALLGLAMIAPAPDIFWGYALIPTVATLPLGVHLLTGRQPVAPAAADRHSVDVDAHAGPRSGEPAQ